MAALMLAAEESLNWPTAVFYMVVLGFLAFLVWVNR